MSTVIADYEHSRKFIAQTPSIPLGTLEEQPEPPSLPETLPNHTTPSPLLTPNRSPISTLITPAVTTKVKVKNIEVNGSTVFSLEELAQAVRPFIGQELTYEQLLEIRVLLQEVLKGRRTLSHQPT